MNKKAIRPVLHTALALALGGTLLGGCGDNGQQSAEPSPAAGASLAPTGGKASEKPLTLSVHFMNGSNVFDDNWPVFKKAAEITNVALKSTLPKTVTDRNEAFNMMMASGEVSDIVLGAKANMDKFGQEGAFMPLQELIDKHAPHIKAFLEARPDVRSVGTAADGSMYFLPFAPDGEAASGWFIRQDWLDKLGLPVPKTVEKYHEVLKAFRDKDPNGNGQADEIPFFSRSNNGAYELLSLWAADQGYVLKNGSIVYGPLEPEYKPGIASVAQWYKEGLIDKEIFTRGNKARDILLGNNTGGSNHDWFASTASFNDTLKDKIPGFHYVPIAPPANVKGEIIEPTARAVVKADGWGIAASNKHPEETIKYFDFWYTEEGRRLANFGVEGLTYHMVDGKPKFTDEILQGGQVTQNLYKYGAQLEFSFHQDFEYERQYLNPIAEKGINEYISNRYIREQIPTLAYTSEEEKQLKNMEASINTYASEMGQKWVLGAESVDATYDAFVSKLKTMGIEEVLKIKNNAYQRYLKQ
ncbi:extracellular solute-binding protein [Paenibacillus sp. YN15]|uniref:extracellular solute-binding protein n=1 Tax=Paenibacillus sp. YN15 TaxID=1742774 RepID=UPI000DCBDDE3|nr:extracellular solute-binding protein [Paenibacillus sp. YN15]RAU91860.1 sugar ABC transporter permease [Paenibacillus sp. YN15]